MSRGAKIGSRVAQTRAVAPIAALCLTIAAISVAAPQVNVSGQVQVVRQNTSKTVNASAKTQDRAGVAIWLVPADKSAAATLAEKKHPKLVQHNKSFEPHVLVVQMGSTVDFPNKDPFFHNVFSLFDGKRFDLGLYEGGSTNSARFDRAGISFLFCNIHPEMSAIVIAVPTPYFAVTDQMGHVAIAAVPDGSYQMHVWYERSSPDELKTLDKTVEISAVSPSLPPIQVIDNGDFKLAHKNKYGQDYTPPSSTAYTHP